MPIIRSGYATQQRNGSTRTYRKARAETLAEETRCHICHEPARPNDPLQADHLHPYGLGGQDSRSNLRAAHRSCNNQKAMHTPSGGA